MTTTAITSNTLRDAGGNWLLGKVGAFEVQAKAFTEGSDEYGMAEESRISKLWIRLNGTVLYDYDRGDVMTNLLTPGDLGALVAAVTSKIA